MNRLVWSERVYPPSAAIRGTRKGPLSFWLWEKRGDECSLFEDRFCAEGALMLAFTPGERCQAIGELLCIAKAERSLTR